MENNTVTVPKTKVLIFTAPAGNGHNAMSGALKEHLVEAHHAEVLVYDIFKPTKFRAWMIGKLYFWLAKHFLGILNRCYQRMKNRDVKKTKKTTLHNLTAAPVRTKAEKVVHAFRPDAVFCAHTAAALICSDLKKEGKLRVPVFNIISDYDIPPYIECCTHVDFYISPSSEIDGDLIRRGIRQEQILYYGIPVQTKFSRTVDKKQARRELGLKEDTFTVMIMNGGAGFGNTLRLIKNIFRTVKAGKVQIVSVCGKNKRLKKQIDSYNRRREGDLLNFGFANNVDQIMSAADLLIGKIGGVAITEAFNKRVCILASTKLPAQEYDNMLFLTRHGACDYIKYEDEAGKMVAQYIEKPDLLTAMREKIEALRKPHATVQIAQAIIWAARDNLNCKGKEYGKENQYMSGT